MSDLVGNPEDRFSRVEALIIPFLLICFQARSAVMETTVLPAPVEPVAVVSNSPQGHSTARAP